MPGEFDTYVLRPAARQGAQFRLDYRQLLNAAQFEAATTVEGPVLVVAGAGSGKTRTLVFRVARLVESGVDPRSVLLLTFTRRAATEMLRRASALLDGRCEHVAGGTFHSFANTVLRRHGGALGIDPSFTILDRRDSEDVLSLLRASAGLDKKERRFPRKQTIATLYSKAVNKSCELSDLIESEYEHLLEHVDDLLSLRDAYAAYKASHQLLDYDDLLVELERLLAEHESVCRRLSRESRFIMVDEYQDTNALQASIVRRLASEHDNVMAVGDDAQSIYSFRGASFRNIMDFPALFEGARVIKLEQNYRSTQAILDVANEIISQASESYTKVLFTETPGGERPLLVAAADENFQSRFVSQRILELREEGVPLDDIAVLFRSSFHSFDLELVLKQHGIPFVKRGGFKFIETAHIKDALAHLRVIANPTDAVAWNRVLLLIDGIGPRHAERLIARLLESDDVPACLENVPGRPFSLDLCALAGLFRRLVTGSISPADQLTEVLRYYQPVLERRYRDDYPKRQRDLEHFVAIAARFRSLESLLSDMALEPPTDSVDDVLADPDEEGMLTLSTVHSAKGLEWHTVFVIWVVDGRFPSAYGMRTEEELEEERRLMYVATTRAKRNLYLSYPLRLYDRASGWALSHPSHFVADIPRRLLRPVQLVETDDDPSPAGGEGETGL